MTIVTELMASPVPDNAKNATKYKIQVTCSMSQTVFGIFIVWQNLEIISKSILRQYNGTRSHSSIHMRMRLLRLSILVARSSCHLVGLRQNLGSLITTIGYKTARYLPRCSALPINLDWTKLISDPVTISKIPPRNITKKNAALKLWCAAPNIFRWSEIFKSFRTQKFWSFSKDWTYLVHIMR